MGYRGHEDWNDMSDYIVHFTSPVPLKSMRKPPEPANEGMLSLAEMMGQLRYIHERDRTGYFRWLQIVGSQILRAGEKPLGAARRVRGIEESQRVVCFSEIPLDMLERLIERRSLYGIGFRKEFLIANGGAPLWYLDQKGEQAPIIRAAIKEREAAGVDPDDPFWRLMPFIDQPGFYGKSPYRWEWEREWRVIGDLPFEVDDVAFLVIPGEEHVMARQFFTDAELEHTGPAYFCPYIDPRWPMDRIQHALKNIPAKPDPSPTATPW